MRPLSLLSLVLLLACGPRSGPAAEPSSASAEPLPKGTDALVQHNLDALNRYRKQAGVAPLSYDGKLSAFALEGSRQLAKDHKPHAHFQAHVKAAMGTDVFGMRAAENQGDWNGVPELDPDAGTNGKKQVHATLQLMMDEGPGGGHHDNMLNPAFHRVGIGLHRVGPLLYLTNDFSD